MNILFPLSPIIKNPAIDFAAGGREEECPMSLLKWLEILKYLKCSREGGRLKYFVLAFITYGTRLTTFVNTVSFVNIFIFQYFSSLLNCSVDFDIESFIKPTEEKQLS